MNESVYDLLKSASRGRLGVDQRFLRQIAAHGSAAAEDLRRFIAEDHEDDPVALDLDLVAIYRILRLPDALPYFLRLIGDQPDEIEDEIVEGMIEISEPAIEPLLALYEDLGEEEGGEVAFLLASLRIHDDRVRKVLVDRLEYDAWDGAICLGLYGDPSTKADIERVLALVPADEENNGLRSDLQHAIDDVSDPKPVEVPRRSPEDIIAIYPEKQGPAFEVLSPGERLDLLKSDDAEIRAGAADSFVNAELTDEQRRRLFDAAKNDSDPNVRGFAWRALSADTDNDRIKDTMLARVSDPNTPAAERTGALIGLAFHLKEANVRPLVDELYDNPETRAGAMEAMRRSLEREFAEYFPRHLDDEDLAIRREAIWGVGYLQISAEVDRLKRFFEDEELRPDALFAYSLALRGETSKGRMQGLLKKIDEAAGGLSEPEEDLVKAALDERLLLAGKEPYFALQADHEHDHGDPGVPPPPGAAKAGRNDLCPCGSGKKYKKCCGA